MDHRDDFSSRWWFHCAIASVMARCFILGAGGFGREVLGWLKQSPDWEKRWDFAGFLDDNNSALGPLWNSPGIFGKIRGFEPQPGDELVCAIGDPRTRLRICRELLQRGARFPVVRHPAAVIGERCQIGAGSILCPGAVLTVDIILGDFVIVNLGATVGHDARVGDGVTLSPHADVTGYAEIAEGAFLGSHASVLPRAKVGAFATVGAGSVVLRSVSSGATVVGVPAKQILP